MLELVFKMETLKVFTKILTATPAVIGLLLGLCQFVLAQEQINEGEIQELLKVKIRTIETLAFHPKLIEATRIQNEQNLSIQTIQQRDDEWSNTESLTPFKRSLQINKAGKILQRLIEDNDSFNEAFLTDNQGANVAAYPATSDYWQGDEEKWSNSFNDGSGLIYIGPLERDDSTQTVAVQVSAPVFDNGRTVGVLVVGVSLSYLETRQQ